MTEDNNTAATSTPIQLSQAELDMLIEKAAERGAHAALVEMGLIDDNAANDLRTLRGLANTIKAMQHTFVQTLVRWLTIGMLVLLFAGVAGKFDSLVHH